MESNVGPKPVRNDLFLKWEGQTDLSGPVWARFDQFYGYTGYRVPDTGHRYTGQRVGGGVFVVQTGRSQKNGRMLGQTVRIAIPRALFLGATPSFGGFHPMSWLVLGRIEHMQFMC